MSRGTARNAYNRARQRAREAGRDRPQAAVFTQRNHIGLGEGLASSLAGGASWFTRARAAANRSGWKGLSR
jgi:hypothetical protein